MVHVSMVISHVHDLISQHVDEAVNSQLKDRFHERIARLQKGEKKAFEELYMNACPKFISPIPPDYEALPENYNKVVMRRAMKMFGWQLCFVVVVVVVVVFFVCFVCFCCFVFFQIHAVPVYRSLLYTSVACSWQRLSNS